MEFVRNEKNCKILLRKYIADFPDEHIVIFEPSSKSKYSSFVAV